MLTEIEKEKTRYHMGYLNVAPAASIQYGIPRPLQTIFLLETAMSNLMVVAEPRVRSILSILDSIECKLVESINRLAATKLAELTLRDDEPQRLEQEYDRWSGRLADLFGVMRYPYSQRFGGTGTSSNSGARNVPVSG